MAANVVNLPYNFDPRWWQAPLWDNLEVRQHIPEGETPRKKHAFLCHHRRAGKDLNCLNIMVAAAHVRIGQYYYTLPTYKQGEKVIWLGQTNDGRRFLDYIPPGLIDKTYAQDMRIQFKNGSMIQVVGTEDPDSVMGTNPVGVVYSEWSLQNPQARAYLSPILVANGGWEIVNGTPRGLNHFHTLYQHASASPDWYTSLVTNHDTKIMSEEAIAAQRLEHPEWFIQQEYYCSFHTSDDLILIPLELITSAVDRDVSVTGAVPVAGLDLGYSLTGDPTALVIRQGGRIMAIHECRKDNYAEIAQWAHPRLQACNCRVVAVDAIGWGAGIVGPLRELGYDVKAVNVAESAPTKERFSRLRDELWYSCREWFESKVCCIPSSLELRGKLMAELSGVKYEMLSVSGKIKVQSKRDMRSDGKESPNIADALCNTFAVPELRLSQFLQAGNESNPFIL